MAELPVVVEVWRGDYVESRHRGSAVAVDRKGRRLLEIGDTSTKIFPRSAVKPLQSLPLIETGAADALELCEAEIALSCASHSGEPQHTETVSAWLSKLGLSPEHLGCGPQSPGHTPTKIAMIERHEKPDRTHNNCSGKHTGMLAVARHRGESIGDYLETSHPIQTGIKTCLGNLCGETLDTAPGTDGCSAPNWPMSLSALATGASRLALGDGTTTSQSRALARMANAMQQHPNLVAGTGRCCTAIMRASPHILAKTGAEGVYLLAHRPTGIGIALKIEDGATRAAETLAIGILKHLGLLEEQKLMTLQFHFEPAIRNFAGLNVGQIAMCPDWLG